MFEKNWKKELMTLAAFLFLLCSAGLANAGQSGGMASGRGPSLPGGIQSFINPDGLGDSLLYGYYNVHGHLNLFNAVNTSTADGAKVRVNFRSAKTGAECLSMSVCLGARDEWTAFLIDNGTTTAICPFDTDTLVTPEIPISCLPFRYESTGGKPGVTADDCREGYFDIIGLMNIPGYEYGSQYPALKVPADCRDYTAGTDLENVLMGNNSIFNVSSLATYSYNAVAVADTKLSPMADTSAIDSGGIPEAMDNGCPEADYIFMKSELSSPFNILRSIGGETEIIVTFPTRSACHTPPPDTMFNSAGCTFFSYEPWSDQGRQQLIQFFPPFPTECLQRSVNVIRLGGSLIWPSTVAESKSITVSEVGWVSLGLSLPSSHPNPIERSITYGSNPTRTAYGLPAVAYTTQSFLEGSASFMTPATSRTTIK